MDPRQFERRGPVRRIAIAIVLLESTVFTPESASRKQEREWESELKRGENGKSAPQSQPQEDETEPQRATKKPRGPGLCIHGADNGVRTRDPHLGKVMLYQLSHVRVAGIYYTRLPKPVQAFF